MPLFLYESMFEIIAYILCGIGLFVLGLFALLGNIRARYAQIFFAFTFVSFAGFLSLFATYHFEANHDLSVFFIQLTNGIAVLGLLCIAYFLYEFPYRTYQVSEKVKVIFFSFIIFSFFLISFTDLVQIDAIIEGGEIVQEEFGVLFVLFTIEIIGLILLIIVLGVQKLKTLHGIDKSKTKIVLTGLSIFMISLLFTNIILPIFNNNMFVKGSVLCSIFFIGPTFYAIQRHRFFNLSYMTLNVLRIFVFSGSFIIILLVFEIIIVRFANNLPEIIKLIIIGGTSVFIIMYLERKFPKFYSRGLRQLYNAMNELQSKINYYDDYNDLIHCVEDVFVRDLHIDNVKIFVVRDKKAKINIPIYIRDQFTIELEKYGDDVVFAEDLQYTKISNLKKRILREGLSSLEAKVCIKLFVEKTLIGFLTFGAKGSKAPYSFEEIAEILKIKQNLEIFLMNFMLSQNLKEENNLMKLIIDKKTKKLNLNKLRNSLVINLIF
jgi:hypothetical protein